GRELGRDEVWFTDDRAENVAAAREFGWDAEVFSRA
ncbi:MAG: HAD family phosphatase, partial [Dermatophilaceae bacterium]|nr:HAD family phosphatase [Dermatophilaceae bacterium]